METYLVHHGIKGQKWGVRRYQNEDGTLTDAGRKRLGRYKERETKKANKIYERQRKAIISENKRTNETTAKAQLDDLYEKHKKEVDAIKNAKLSDIKDENKAAAKAIASQFGLSVAGLGAAAAATYVALSAGYIVFSPALLASSIMCGVGALTSPFVGGVAKTEQRIKRAEKDD